MIALSSIGPQHKTPKHVCNLSKHNNCWHAREKNDYHLLFPLSFGAIEHTYVFYNLLKPAKTVIILTVCDCSAEHVMTIREWLKLYIPDWSSTQILDCAAYLSHFTGSCAGARQWTAPISKFRIHTAEIRDSAGSLAARVRQFNVMACTVSAQLLYPTMTYFELN